jgi:hypothetical protein
MSLENVFYWTGGIFLICLLFLGILSVLSWIWNEWLKKCSRIFFRSIYLTLVTYYPNRDKFYGFEFEDKDGNTYKIIKIDKVNLVVKKEEGLDK